MNHGIFEEHEIHVSPTDSLVIHGHIHIKTILQLIIARDSLIDLQERKNTKPHLVDTVNCPVYLSIDMWI